MLAALRTPFTPAWLIFRHPRRPRMAAGVAFSGVPWDRKGIVSCEIATALVKVGGLNLDDAKLIATIR